MTVGPVSNHQGTQNENTYVLLVVCRGGEVGNGGEVSLGDLYADMQSFVVWMIAEIVKGNCVRGD